ncbi:PTS mannitol transporter subunit IICBA [Clostridia bacterium]|nr:PTS mannitol transporter subunit IICBA [Clostridia bacterium]
MSTDTNKGSSSERIQNFGRALSGMVMPNIGAFIAWGFITALFIETGWLPNASLAEMVGPMIVYLLPLLIGYTGGKIVGGVSGGVVGAVATMGVIVSASIPMFMGAMIVGPLGGLCAKKFDEAVHGKIKPGFEMLVNNFGHGIIAVILAILSLKAFGPAVLRLTGVINAGVEGIVSRGLLPIVSLIVEPAKVLFLNNALNHGIFGPLGVVEVADAGKSIFFLLETNPGPGLGILLAYWVFSKGMIKSSAPGAIIIHFLGGIHEIYFPYVLMKPILVLAVIAGGASGVATFSLLGAGLVATPAPGSIFALIAMTPKGGLFPVLAGVVVSTVVSFLVAGLFLRKADFDKEELDDAKKTAVDMKGKESSVIKTSSVKKIVVACDAGMGSSAMGATILRNKVKAAGLDIEVINTSIENIPQDADIVITQEVLTARAREAAKNAEHISIDNFMGTPLYDELVERLKK